MPKLPKLKTEHALAIAMAAQATGANVNDILTFALQESSFNNKAVSKTGAKGLFQITDQKAKEAGIDPFNVLQAATLVGNDLNRFGQLLASKQIEPTLANKFLLWNQGPTGGLQIAAAASGRGKLNKARRNTISINFSDPNKDSILANENDQTIASLFLQEKTSQITEKRALFGD